MNLFKNCFLFTSRTESLSVTEGAEEFLLDPKNGVTKVKEELAIHKISLEYRITFLQVLCLYFVLFGQINGKVKLGGAQPPETFKSAFEAASA
ncbi:hypothetical protein F2Q69_00001642 [Brassica cretica]|uniref:Uncharacterized protein n=1 Tax=Brassica cretica TaxID=69181 RepID=A0A8S9NX43_BRACR|nr:hypothetical protein F2Q69_00001642 [Brassica cretica]